MGIAVKYRSQCWNCGLSRERGEMVAGQYICDLCMRFENLGPRDVLDAQGLWPERIEIRPRCSERGDVFVDHEIIPARMMLCNRPVGHKPPCDLRIVWTTSIG